MTLRMKEMGRSTFFFHHLKKRGSTNKRPISNNLQPFSLTENWIPPQRPSQQFRKHNPPSSSSDVSETSFRLTTSSFKECFLKQVIRVG